MNATISLIVAVAENGVIGNKGGMPWRMPSDLKTFRRLTMGQPIVMGRKTFQSIGKPLDGRDNIVVSRDGSFRPDGVIVSQSLETALEIAVDCARRRGADEIMVIGGAEIYRQAMASANRIYLTRIAARPDGDATFADPAPNRWRLVGEVAIPPDPRDEFSAVLQTYERHSPDAG